VPSLLTNREIHEAAVIVAEQALAVLGARLGARDKVMGCLADGWLTSGKDADKSYRASIEAWILKHHKVARVFLVSMDEGERGVWLTTHRELGELCKTLNGGIGHGSIATSMLPGAWALTANRLGEV
jgi:hypothetical protein